MTFPLFTSFRGNKFVPCHPQFLLLYQYFLLSVAFSGKCPGWFVLRIHRCQVTPVSSDLVCYIGAGKTPPSFSYCSKIGLSYVPVNTCWLLWSPPPNTQLLPSAFSWMDANTIQVLFLLVCGGYLRTKFCCTCFPWHFAFAIQLPGLFLCRNQRLKTKHTATNAIFPEMG